MQSQGLTSKLRRPTLKKSNSVKETFLQSCHVVCLIANVFYVFLLLKEKHLCSNIALCVLTLQSRYKKQLQKTVQFVLKLQQKHGMQWELVIGVTFRSVNQHFAATKKYIFIIAVRLLWRLGKKPSALRNIVYSTGLILRGGKKHDYISILRYKEH